VELQLASSKVNNAMPLERRNDLRCGLLVVISFLVGLYPGKYCTNARIAPSTIPHREVLTSSRVLHVFSRDGDGRRVELDQAREAGKPSLSLVAIGPV
jgi:hypothetical protein